MADYNETVTSYDCAIIGGSIKDDCRGDGCNVARLLVGEANKHNRIFGNQTLVQKLTAAAMNLTGLAASTLMGRYYDGQCVLGVCTDYVQETEGRLKLQRPSHTPTQE